MRYLSKALVIVEAVHTHTHTHTYNLKTIKLNIKGRVILSCDYLDTGWNYAVYLSCL